MGLHHDRDHCVRDDDGCCYDHRDLPNRHLVDFDLDPGLVGVVLDLVGVVLVGVDRALDALHVLDDHRGFDRRLQSSNHPCDLRAARVQFPIRPTAHHRHLHIRLVRLMLRAFRHAVHALGDRRGCYAGRALDARSLFPRNLLRYVLDDHVVHALVLVRHWRRSFPESFPPKWPLNHGLLP